MARYIGDYEVLSELGSGHFGTVYLAVGETPARGRNPAKRRQVAVKKLKDSTDIRSVDLLLQEFALLDQVKHRGIVRVFEFLEDENAVVMEHIHGVTLRQVLEELAKAREQVFTEAAIEIGCELADALYQAYTTPGDNGEPLQLVHRDLKPANVMLTPQGEVKILDFGLARVDNADFAKDDKSRVKGTPIYMAPEQARGEEIDHRTDLFALGLILYELLMNEPAYRISKSARDPVAEVFCAIESGELTRQCGELEARLPAHGPIVTRLLQRRPEDRYQTGHDLLVDLRRQLYRDRGSYLKEFCEFFFGSVCDIGEPPKVDEVAGSSRSTGRGRRLSIEERLRQSMAREAQARTAADGGPRETAPTPPTPSRATAGRATPTAGRPTAPAAPAAPGRAPAAPRGTRPPPPPAEPARPSLAPPGVPMSASNSDGPGRRPVRPPVGGGASRAEPFRPPSGSGGGLPLKQVGQRSPDETGMLEMVPLSANQDATDAGADPSATAFFAIPAPKADRSRPGGAGAGTPMPSPMSGPGGMAPPGPPPAAGGGFGAPPPPPGGGFGAPPPPPGGGFGGPPPAYGAAPVPNYGAPTGMPGTMAPPPVQPAIQGPVAGYGGQGAAPTPFQVAGPVAGAPPADADQRVQSTRLYAILFACFVLLSIAIVAAVWLRPGKDDGEQVASATPSTAPATPAVVEGVSRKKRQNADTGVAAPPPLQAVHTPSPRTSGGGSSTPTPTAPKAPAAPPSTPGAITVKLGDPSTFTSVTVLCPDGTRAKGTFAGGSATVAGVPNGQSCSLHFNGGISPGRFNGASAGSTLTCSMVGSGMVCH